MIEGHPTTTKRIYLDAEGKMTYDADKGAILHLAEGSEVSDAATLEWIKAQGAKKAEGKAKADPKADEAQGAKKAEDEPPA